MRARFSFNLELGIFTVSCMAVLALRMRVSMSAMGSVMVMAAPPSPAGLRDAGDLSGVHQLPQTDPAQPELAVDGLGPPTASAPGVAPDLELGCALLLLDQCLLGHGARRSPA